MYNSDSSTPSSIITQYNKISPPPQPLVRYIICERPLIAVSTVNVQVSRWQRRFQALLVIGTCGWLIGNVWLSISVLYWSEVCLEPLPNYAIKVSSTISNNNTNVVLHGAKKTSAFLFFEQLYQPVLIIFGMLNPEKMWHEHFTDLSTSPVRCSHFTLGNAKKVRVLCDVVAQHVATRIRSAQVTYSCHLLTSVVSTWYGDVAITRIWALFFSFSRLPKVAVVVDVFRSSLRRRRRQKARAQSRHHWPSFSRRNNESLFTETVATGLQACILHMTTIGVIVYYDKCLMYVLQHVVVIYMQGWQKRRF